MLAIDHLRLLDNVDIPPGVHIRVTDDIGEFMTLKAQLNVGSTSFFGTAYRQGGRLHFSTAMSMRDLTNIALVNQGDKHSTLDEMRKKANRPKEVAHGKALGQYLADTACAGQTFVLPAILMNYGLEWTDDMPKADLVLFAGASETMVWPAIFTPPSGVRLPVTDGGHRADEIATKLNAGAGGRLPENGVSVIFIFEDDWDAYHQDFADAAKGKKMAGSLTVSWDRRERGNHFAQDLVGGNKYLKDLVDVTSNSVNLSNTSTKAWSMSAMRSAVEEIYPHERNAGRLSSYFDQVFNDVPILADIANGGTPGAHRNQKPWRGGCVLLRGVGAAVLTQGYKYAVENNMPFPEIGDKLASVDWHVLKDGARDQGDEEDAASYLATEAQPIWSHMLAMMAGDRNFRIKGTKDGAEEAFLRIRKQVGF